MTDGHDTLDPTFIFYFLLLDVIFTQSVHTQNTTDNPSSLSSAHYSLGRGVH
jgi:hypothetical protein